MKISKTNILMTIIILAVIPAGCLLLEMKSGSDSISFDQLSLSQLTFHLMIYYLMVTVVFVAFYIIRKIIAYLNREE